MSYKYGASTQQGRGDYVETAFGSTGQPIGVRGEPVRWFQIPPLCEAPSSPARTRRFTDVADACHRRGCGMSPGASGACSTGSTIGNLLVYPLLLSAATWYLLCIRHAPHTPEVGYACAWLRYRPREIQVTENGFSVRGESDMQLPEALDDTPRVEFFQGYVAAAVEAVTVDKVGPACAFFGVLHAQRCFHRVASQKVCPAGPHDGLLRMESAGQF